MNTTLRIATACFSALLLAACAALHPPARATATLRTDAPVVDPAGIAHGGEWPGSTWWKAYADPQLDQLIDVALSTGPDLAIAAARMRQAQEEVRVTSAALGLGASANGTYTFQRLSDHGLFPPSFLGFHWYDQTDLGVTIRYQFDWWGEQRATLAASLDRARALQAEREAAGMVLASSVAASYFGWQADTHRIALLQEAVTLQQDVLAVARRRVAAELAPVDDELSARSRLAALREELALLEGSRQQHVVSMAALLGVPADGLPALQPTELPAARTALPDDVGTNLLARRPDILASRWRVEAALRDTDIARAGFYPDLSINALAGLSSIELGSLLHTDAAAPRLGIAVDLPLFQADEVRARHRASLAGLEVAIAGYEQSIVHAAREAGAAAASLQQARAQLAQRTEQRDAAGAIAASAEARLQRGLINRGTQLAARQEEILQRERVVQTELATLLADVQLRQALGGDAAPETPAP